MKRLMLATAAGAALLAGATAANAQYYYDDGYHYGHRGPFVERGVGLQVGPVGIGVYDTSPAYDYDYGYRPAYDYTYRYNRTPRDNSVYESNSWRAHQWLPQSPPGGGY